MYGATWCPDWQRSKKFRRPSKKPAMLGCRGLKLDEAPTAGLNYIPMASMKVVKKRPLWVIMGQK
jgi:hypothetical protein